MLVLLDSYPLLPNAADTGDASVSPGSSPTWSAWTQLIASTARLSTHGILTISPSMPTSVGAFVCEVQLATGGAGAEVNLLDGFSFIMVSHAQGANTPQLLTFTKQIAASSRVSFRARMADTPISGTRVAITLQGRS